jgi:general nucleoside transport system ATP-binding protein
MQNSAEGANGASSVRLLGIVKRFARVTACDCANFSAFGGHISALVGENGAGKTTLMRILAGEIAPDSGAVLIGGQLMHFGSPGQAAAAGIAMVEQEPRIIDALTVFENIILGNVHIGLFSRRRAVRRVTEVFTGLGLDAPLTAPASALTPPERQRVAIARAVLRGARVLILDEPTSLLGPSERRSLFDVMKCLTSRGAAVIFISHKLGEVFEIADTVTVLRHGETVLSASTADTSPTEIAEAMVGADFTSEAGSRAVPGETVVKLAGVSTSSSGRRALKNVSLDLRRGEIVGIAGVAGNGQRDLADIVAGLLKPAAGALSCPFAKPSVALVGEDVDSMDLVAGMKVWENRILGREEDFTRWFGIARWRSRKDTQRLAAEFDIKGDTDIRASALSGGSRQRLVLARELDGEPGLLIVEEPTRGLDVRGAELVRQRIRETASSGAAVLLISYDLDELYALADRMLVISSGRLLEPANQPPLRTELGQLMTGMGA